MAPQVESAWHEQVAGEALSPQTDVWALGLITYFALTGRRYWPAANKPDAGIQALFAEILGLPLPPPSQRIREDGLELRLPLAFDAWLLRCLDRRPARRFASAGQAIEALEHALALGGGAPTLPPRSEPPAIGRFAVRRLSTTASYDAEMFSAVRHPTAISSAASPEAASSPSLPAVAAEHTRAPRGRRRQALAILAAAGVGVLAAAAVVALRQPSNERELTTVVTAQEPAPEVLPERGELPRPDLPRLEPLEPPAGRTSPAPTDAEPNPPPQREPAPVPPPPPREPARGKVSPDKSARPKAPKGPDAPCASFDPYTGRCVRGEARAR